MRWELGSFLGLRIGFDGRMNRRLCKHETGWRFGCGFLRHSMRRLRLARRLVKQTLCFCRSCCLDLGKLRSRRPPIVAQSLKLSSLALLQSLCAYALIARPFVLDANIELGIAP